MCKVNKMTGSTTLAVLLFSCIFCWWMMTMHVCAGNDREIDASHPKIGAEDIISYSGEEETYVVKVGGLYEVTVYGAQGGWSIGKNAHEGGAHVWGESDGYGGSMMKAQIELEEDCELTLCVGEKGGVGTCDTYHGDNLRKGPGGYPDGGTGRNMSYFNDKDHDKNANALGGGGGGSSYIKFEGEKIISAKGGNGASIWINSSDMHNAEAKGGTGGGSTFVKDAGGLSWLSDERQEEDGVHEGNGQIVFKLLSPKLYLTLTADCEDWTTEDVTIQATIHSDKTLPVNCYLWENVENMEESWTDADHVTVSKNGTYLCRGRDDDGNETFAEIEITNIDREAPGVSFQVSESDWTKGPVRITIEVNDGDGSGLPALPIFWASDGMTTSGGISAADGMPTEADSELEIVWGNLCEQTMEENGRLSVLARDRLGNMREWTYEVTNIDHTAPTVSLLHEGKWTKGETVFTIDAKDLQPDGKTYGCGLADEAFSLDGEHYTDDNTVLVSKEGEVTVWVRDRLGNISENHIHLTHDKQGGSGSHHGGGGNGGPSGENASDAETLNPLEDAFPEDEFPEDLLQIEIDERLREYKGLTESRSSAAGAVTCGVLVKEEPGFAKIAAALGAHLGENIVKEAKEGGVNDGNSAAGENGDSLTDDSETFLQGGIPAALSKGKQWVTRFIQEWKHVITYSLTGILFFGLMGLGCFLFLIRKRKK